MGHISLTLLGSFSASLDGTPITAFDSNKVRALLAFLMVENNLPHSRDYLASLLWPDSTNQAARTNLRSSLANLRKILKDSDNQPSHLLIKRETIQFNSHSDYWLDVTALTSVPLDIDNQTSQLEKLERAVSLYQDTFLQGFSLSDSNLFEEWVSLKREQISRHVLEMLDRLVEIHQQMDKYDKAEFFARKMVEIEPWNEEAHRHLIRLLAFAGKRSAALVQYETCCQLLEKELAVNPSTETIKLYKAIRDGTLEKPAAPPAKDSPAPGPCPYKGLQYFDEQDTDLFFGREMLTAKLMMHLHAMLRTISQEESRSEGNNFLAVVGASGSGKSSIVRAGLVPAIRRGKILADGTSPPEGSANWHICVLTPTQHPLQSLAVGLAQHEPSVLAITTLMDDLSRDDRSLNIYITKLLLPQKDARLLLIIDQFEELFTQCRDEAERVAFISNIMTAAAQGGQTLVVIVLRADFYAHCAQYPALRQALCDRQEYIGPMHQDELKRAIEEPAHRGTWEFEAGLVDLILRDTGDEPGALPLLSHALTETWLRRRGRTMTLQGYVDAGEVRGAIAFTANTLFARLLPKQQIIARQVFLRLTEMGEGTQDSRRRASLDELISSPVETKPLQEVLNLLADARLVTLSAGTAEIAHEALIREWPLLREWLTQDRESLRLHRHLTETAQAWERMDRDEGELYRGARLSQALEWSALSGNEAIPNKLEREFLQASQESAEQHAIALEAQRQRELEAAMELAEVQRQRAEVETQRAEEQTQAAKILHKRAIYLAGSLVVLAVMVFVALVFGWQERRQATIATGRELALAAQNNLAVDPERSILLGLRSASAWASVGQSIPYDLQDTLHQAIQASRVRLTWSAGDETIRSVSFIQPGNLPRVVTSNLQAGSVTVWDPVANQLLLTISTSLKAEPNQGSALPISLSPDGKLIAIPDEANIVKLWDIADNQVYCNLYSNNAEVQSTYFSPNGFLLAAQESTNYLIWDVVTCQKILEIPTVSTGFTKALVISQDGGIVAAITKTQELSIYEITSGRIINTIPIIFDVTTLAFSPDGRFLVGAGRENYFQVWDIATGEVINTITSSGHTFSGGQAEVINYSPDGKNLLLMTTVYDPGGGEELFSLLGHTKPVFSLAYNSDGNEVITASYDGTVKLWDLTLPHEVLTLSHSSGFIYGIAFSPDGKWLATAGQDQTTIIWEIPSGKKLKVLQSHADTVNTTAFSPDGVLLATGGADGKVIVWDTHTWQVLHTLTGFGEDRSTVPYILGVYSIKFSPLCHTESTLSSICPLAGVGMDGHLIVWDALTGQPLITYQDPLAGLMSVAFSPDGTLLVVGNASLGGADSWATILDVTTGNVVRSLPSARAWTWGVAFSPAGDQLATINFYGDGKVWDVESGEPVVSLNGIQDGGFSITYNPSGTLLAAGSNGYVSLVDAKSGLLLFPLLGNQSLVARTEFSPDGTYLATAGFDGTARVYVVPAEDLLSLAKSRLTRSLTLEECQKYLHQVPCP